MQGRRLSCFCYRRAWALTGLLATVAFLLGLYFSLVAVDFPSVLPGFPELSWRVPPGLWPGVHVLGRASNVSILVVGGLAGLGHATAMALAAQGLPVGVYDCIVLAGHAELASQDRLDVYRQTQLRLDALLRAGVEVVTDAKCQASRVTQLLRRHHVSHVLVADDPADRGQAALEAALQASVAADMRPILVVVLAVHMTALPLETAFRRNKESRVAMYHQIHTMAALLVRVPNVFGPDIAGSLVNTFAEYLMARETAMVPAMCGQLIHQADAVTDLVALLRLRWTGCATIVLEHKEMCAMDALKTMAVHVGLTLDPATVRALPAPVQEDAWQPAMALHPATAIIPCQRPETLSSRLRQAVFHHGNEYPAILARDVIMTTYFTSVADPQRSVHHSPNRYGYIRDWFRSLVAWNLSAVIFHDGLDDNFMQQLARAGAVTFSHVGHLGNRSTNDARFYVYAKYLAVHPEIRRILCTDISG